MAAEAIVTIGESFRYETGDEDLLGGRVSLVEGKRASSLEFTIADPDGELANALPLVLVEDVPSRRATVEVTFVTTLGAHDSAVVIEGQKLRTEDGALFETADNLFPDDFSEGDTQTLKQGQATVEARAVEPGAAGNIPDDADLELADDLPDIARVFVAAPGSGGRDAGKTGTQVPVRCWLGPSGEKTPPKVFEGYLSQHTYSGPPGRIQLMAVDRSAEMRRKERARALNATNVDEMVRRLAAENGLQADLSQAELGGVQLSRHLQHGASDWTIVNRVLERVGHRVKVRGETVYVTKVGRTRAQPRKATLRPRDVSSFDFQVDELTKHSTPNLTALSGAKVSEYREGTPSRRRPIQLDRTGVADGYISKPSSIDQQDERARQAEARQKRQFGATLQATELYSRLDTDDYVELQRWGRRYNGRWWIDSLTHDFEGTTSFTLTSDSDE